MNAQSGNVPNVATSMRGGMCCGAKSAKMIKVMAPHWLNYVESGDLDCRICHENNFVCPEDGVFNMTVVRTVLLSWLYEWSNIVK